MSDKFALITGGTGGLGQVLVRRFWAEGYNIAIVARSEADAQKLINYLPFIEGQEVYVFCGDLSVPNDVANIIGRVKNKIPSLDLLINNAAIQGPIGPFLENDESAWLRAIQVNLFAPIALCKGLVPMLAKSKYLPNIINISGGGATSPRANFSAYSTAKTGLVRFSETLAEELKEFKIRVNCIAPGAMKTKMLEDVFLSGKNAGTRELLIAEKVMKDGGASMESVADLAVFLASKLSEGISGKLISAVWDDWQNWPKYTKELQNSDVYTLRRVVGRDRQFSWGDR